MKGRPQNIRKISFIPSMSGFKPYGGNAESGAGEAIFLFYEEYEALRLNDYEDYSQCEAATLMGISRPTFTRIYMKARKKIARAFIEGRQIIIEGGKVELNDEWYCCQRCNAIFTATESNVTCALCGSDKVSRYTLKAAESQQAIPVPVRIAPAAKERKRGCGKGRCRRNGATDTDTE